MTPRSLLLWILCMALPPAAGAAGAAGDTGTTLEGCLALARAHAPGLRASEADLTRAEQAIREARAALAPTLKLQASYLQNSEGPKAVFPVPGRPSPEVVALGSANVVDLRTDAQLTLYSGGRDGARVRAAQAARDGARVSVTRTDADLVLRVSQSFYRVIAAERLADAATEAQSSARTELMTSAARVRAGVAQRVDSLRAAADLAQRAAALVRSTEAVRIARAELAESIGAPVDSTAALVPPGEPDARVPAVEDEVARALRARPELAAYDLDLRRTDAQLAAERAGRLPQVNLSATAEYVGPNIESNYFDFTDPGLKTYKLYAMLGVSLPILDGGLVRSRVEQLAAQRVAIAERRREAELAVRTEVERALSDVRVALAVWPSDSTRVRASREALRLAEAGYKGGTGTASDVRDAESALADARAEEAQTLMDYWIARAALDHATGAGAGKER